MGLVWTNEGTLHGLTIVNVPFVGSYGIVLEALDTKTGEKVAVKRVCYLGVLVMYTGRGLVLGRVKIAVDQTRVDPSSAYDNPVLVPSSKESASSGEHKEDAGSSSADTISFKLSYGLFREEEKKKRGGTFKAPIRKPAIVLIGGLLAVSHNAKEHALRLVVRILVRSNQLCSFPQGATRSDVTHPTVL